MMMMIIIIINTTARLGGFLKKIWDRKAMYVQYVRSIDRRPIVAEDALLWLSKGDLKGETENEIIAAQDRELKPKCHLTKILKTETDNNCKLCQQCDYHIISACPGLAKEQHAEIYDRVCVKLHISVCHKIG